MTKTSRLVVAGGLLTVLGGGAFVLLRPRATTPEESRSESTTAPTAAAAATTNSAAEPTTPTPTTPPATPAAPGAETPPANQDFAPLFAQRLADWAGRNHLVATADHNFVRFDLDTLQLETRVEHDKVTDDGKRGVGIAVGVALPEGGSSFHFVTGAIGVGRTREEAIDQAVGGWLGLTGNALLEAVPRRAVSKTSIVLGPFNAYPGTIAVRGTTDLHWSPTRERQLLEALAPAFRNLSPASSHSVAISIMVLGGGAIDGQCIVDDGQADELCKLALKFDWTGSADGYMVRQVYVLRPRSPGAR